MKPQAPIRIAPLEAAQLLYPVAPASGATPRWRAELNLCARGSVKLRVRCLLTRRYRKDPLAMKSALALYGAVGVVAGLRPKQTRNGGWRGVLKMVPELPIGRRRRKHLKWVTQSFGAYRDFFSWLAKGARAPLRYRYRHLAMKFYQTLGKRTPSASAWEWNIAYNLNGSLLWHAAGVEETLFHEIFHLNDFDHKYWSPRALKTLYQGILKRCRGKYNPRRKRQHSRYGRCLRPFAPNRTKVRRDNVYYAFHRESDVGEYAAELAVRYYFEQRRAQGKLTLRQLKKALGDSAPGAFKCGSAVNAKAWRLLADEFFGGVDRTPACPPAPR